jgi:hypothetical protein
MHKYIRVCPTCQKQFFGTQPSSKYCSVRCSFKARPSAEQRFWACVKKAGPEECWEWQGRFDRDGYGRFFANGAETKAHRFSYKLHKGAIPQNSNNILHSCPNGDNRKCVNYNHLRPGTHAENVADMVSRKRNARGEAAGPSKLTRSQVDEIRELHSTGNYNYPEIGKLFNVYGATIRSIVKKITWKD